MSVFKATELSSNIPWELRKLKHFLKINPLGPGFQAVPIGFCCPWTGARKEPAVLLYYIF